MIKIGDIVYLKRRGGFLHEESRIIKQRIGLVIKEHSQKGAISQYYVQFDKNDPKWYYEHDLHRIKRERN